MVIGSNVSKIFIRIKLVATSFSPRRVQRAIYLITSIPIYNCILHKFINVNPLVVIGVCFYIKHLKFLFFSVIPDAAAFTLTENVPSNTTFYFEKTDQYINLTEMCIGDKARFRLGIHFPLGKQS